ncbi:leucine--tRNA ligase, mitochondrial [Daktulosphaira vitifoliae]|uniref:leucine--tRNA ligase, mitochondrial n=1 Tax=Daktulosphaira vitifoliae TaxID=58002 RepID=UPI0021A99AC7|nr:leucine--tRNA ligase, mitochondrial [Daktulosphaira vitifoliae]
MIRSGIFRTCTCIKSFKNNKPSLRRFSNDIWNEDLSLDVKLRIEKYWKEKLSRSTYNVKNVNNKFYVLSMFPYPSGRLHMGHVRIYVIADSISRFHRMNGQNVFQPMGWDAFGLPAENAAISHGLAPDKWTFSNIQYMKEQLMQLGCSFDWSNEISTCDPLYYKWTQWIFLKMFESGLVYSKEAEVNWDPVDKTVLANEQVDENGHSWRSGALVEKKILKQWFIRTTKFSKALYDGLNDSSLEGWRDVINLQKHWIGECDGYIFDFNLYIDNVYCTVLNIWTSQPEYVPLSAFICIKPNSFIHKHYVIKSTQIFIKNFINDKMLPILVTDEVEYPDSKDVRLAIPSVYEKDKELARKHNIPYEDNKSKMSKEAVCEKAKQLNIGGYPVSSKLQDWLISRQRYWGTPVPIIHCKKCGQQCVPEEQLPVMLPILDDNCNKNSLEKAENWIKTNCPKCGGEAIRETDTMDTFVDSSWYFLRYLDPKNNHKPYDQSLANKMMPVDIYIGGKEHAVLHLYYARFVNYFLHSINLSPYQEPFKNLLVQGMVMGQSFKDKTNGQYLKQDQVVKKGNKYFTKDGNHPVTTVWEKMSKSRHNGVEPSSTLQEYGIDTMRLLILSSVAPTSNRNWNSETFPGVLNWQQKLWSIIQQFRHIRSCSLQQDNIDSSKFHDEQTKLYEARNYYVKKTSNNYRKSYQLSVAISFLQGLSNILKKSSKELVKYSAEYERLLAVQIIMLAPMAPHFASALWSGFVTAPGRINTNWTQIKWEEDVIVQSWPEVDDNYELNLYCLVNNAIKCVLKMSKKDLKLLTKQKALEIALKQDIIQEYTSSWNILDTTFQMFEDDDGYLHIKTDRKSESKKNTENSSKIIK